MRRPGHGPRPGHEASHATLSPYSLRGVCVRREPAHTRMHGHGLIYRRGRCGEPIDPYNSVEDMSSHSHLFSTEEAIARETDM